MYTNGNKLAWCIKNGRYNDFFNNLYGEDQREVQIKRYTELLDKCSTLFDSEDDVRMFCAPGRVELCGNHTDHNGGCVIAGSLTLDMAAAVCTDDTVTLMSDGYSPIRFDPGEIRPDKNKYGMTESIIKGVMYYFRQHGYRAGGFKAYVTSDVLKGSGMSSSAAFEILICTILNTLYNDGKADEIELSVIAQQAENVFFGKPCGLMDQLACACGGVVFIDFFDNKKPAVKKIGFNALSEKYDLCILDTGGSHTNLTDDYAAVINEMSAVAKALGKNRLADASRADFYAAIPHLKDTVSHRAILRAAHFYDENERVKRLCDALACGDAHAVCDILNKSGDSSFEYLQNIYSPVSPDKQEIALALKLAKDFLKNDGACRVHGGGFAGTTLNLVPKNITDDFKRYMEGFFGSGSCRVLGIRKAGGAYFG